MDPALWTIVEQAAALRNGTLKPAALVDELEGPRPVRPVKLLGENLVLFRDEQGRYGLMDRHCAHRGADLAFGRLEHSGVRCSFHGWLFDATGQCIETPTEPGNPMFHRTVKIKGYPCVEKAGVVHAAIGRCSMTAQQIHENAVALVNTLIRLKPATAKGTYLRGAALSST